MAFFIRLFIFLGAVVLGYCGLRYNYWLVKTLGKNDWLEKYLPGGSFTFYQLASIAVIVLGCLYLFGVF